MSDKLSAKDLEFLNEFIENREPGVALEWLHATVVRDSIELSAAQEQEFRRLADLLEIGSVVPGPRPAFPARHHGRS
jgi:hypothetical protein